MNRYHIAQIIALGATVCTVGGFFIDHFVGGTFGDMIVLIGGAAGIASYIFGGLLTAIKMAVKIAKWAWFFGPFPVNIALVLMAFVYVGIVLIFLPIIPVRKAYKESEYYYG